jgi:hypothetical protein
MYDMRARDDDPYLYLAVAKKLRIDHLWKYELLLELDYPAVIRARRAVQEVCEELRGKAYGKRQAYVSKYKEIYKPNYFEKMQIYINKKMQEWKDA